MSIGCPLHGAVDVLRDIQQHRSSLAPTTVTIPPLLMCTASLFAKPRLTFFPWSLCPVKREHAGNDGNGESSNSLCPCQLGFHGSEACGHQFQDFPIW